MNDIPQSNALQEARVDSLSELFSRDPEKLSSQDLDKIILELRLARQRFLQAEEAGRQAKANKGSKVSKTELLKKPIQLSLEQAEDLGL